MQQDPPQTAASAPEEPGAAPEPPAAVEQRRERHFWVRAAGLAALGLVLAAVLSSALLSINHAPQPHHVPLGYVGTATAREALAARAGEALYLKTYDDRDAAATAIHRLDVYGALVVTDRGVELLKSTAASPQVAGVLAGLVGPGPAGTPAPAVTEVSPLPPGDSGGGSLAVLLQVVVIGGMIGALGLGRLVPRYRANWGRGELPVLFLVLYALTVGAALTAIARAFGVGNHVDVGTLTVSLALVNLAVTASISAIVSVVGVAGTAVGGLLYFLLGSPISGAATALPLLPTAWREFGQALPPGAGATLLRRVLYFPDAPLGTPLLTLGLYAAIGAIVLAAVNLLAGAQHRNSLTDLP